MATVFVFNNVGGGDWNTSANWTPNGVPAAGDTAQITSGGTYTVSTTQNETIAILETAKSVTLAIGSHTTFDVTNGTGPGANAGAITVANGATIELGGTFLNSGSIALNATTSNTALQVDGAALTLSGAGTVAMTDNSLNAIATNGAPVLSNAANTISGAGTIGNGGLTLFNGGKIIGNGAANELILNLDNGFNSGTLEGTTAQGLLISAFELDQTANGVVLASGSGARVHIGDTTVISGGTLKTVGSGAAIDVVNGGGGALVGVAIASGSLVSVANASLALFGMITNSGTISVGGGGLLIADETSGTTLTGGGKVTLAGGAIGGNGGAIPAPLTNLNNVIDGDGDIGSFAVPVALINKGTVNADTALQLVLHSGPVTNSGIMEATSTGGLVFHVATSNAKTIEALGTNTKVVIASTVTNTPTGLILASGSGAHVDLQGGTLAGGTLQTSGAGAMIDVVSGTNGTLDGSSAGHPLTNKGLFVVSAGATANIAGTIVNSNTISVGGNGSGGVLRVALGGASLQGNGKVILSDFGSGSIQMVTSSGSGGTLTNVGNTIMGAGTIGGSGTTLINQAAGVINGNDFSALVLSGTVSNAGVLKSTQIAGGLVIAGTVVNSKTIEALGAGVGLTISGTVSNSKSGVVLASGVGAHVDLDAATVSGGMLQTMGVGAAIQVTSGNTAAISGAGLAMGAVLDVHAGADLYLSGTIANRGTISVGDANGGASLLVHGSATLSGGGSVALASGTVTTDPLASGTLTNIDNKIHGWGQIALVSGANLTLVNKGTVC